MSVPEPEEPWPTVASEAVWPSVDDEGNDESGAPADELPDPDSKDGVSRLGNGGTAGLFTVGESAEFVDPIVTPQNDPPPEGFPTIVTPPPLDELATFDALDESAAVDPDPPADDMIAVTTSERTPAAVPVATTALPGFTDRKRLRSLASFLRSLAVLFPLDSWDWII